jgi:hypothetical protein
MPPLPTMAALGCAILLCEAALPGHSQPAIPEKPAAYTAPLELIHDKPFVSVMVNGRGPYRFLIDTGTGGEALVTPELARELSLPVVGHAKLTDPSGIGEQRSDIMRIDSLNIAGVEFSDVDAVLHDLYGDTECQGVLGFALFEDYLLTLDFPGRRMILSTGKLDTRAEGSVLPFRMQDGVPIVHLSIEQQQFEAQIDSGGTGLSVPLKDSGELKFQQPPVEFASGESVSTRFEIKAARLQSDVKLGRYSFKKAFVEINSAFPLVNIGSTPLQHFVITFDQASELVRLYSSESTLHLDASPAIMDLVNQPRHEASDRRLVPVG